MRVRDGAVPVLPSVFDRETIDDAIRKETAIGRFPRRSRNVYECVDIIRCGITD